MTTIGIHVELVSPASSLVRSGIGGLYMTTIGIRVELVSPAWSLVVKLVPQANVCFQYVFRVDIIVELMSPAWLLLKYSHLLQ